MNSGLQEGQGGRRLFSRCACRLYETLPFRVCVGFQAKGLVDLTQPRRFNADEAASVCLDINGPAQRPRTMLIPAASYHP